MSSQNKFEFKLLAKPLKTALFVVEIDGKKIKFGDPKYRTAEEKLVKRRRNKLIKDLGDEKLTVEMLNKNRLGYIVLIAGPLADSDEEVMKKAEEILNAMFDESENKSEDSDIVEIVEAAK